MCYFQEVRACQRSACPLSFHSPFFVRSEANYILEWAWYHILVGFQHIWLYDNGSTDGGNLLLKPLIELGYVTLIDFPSPPERPWARQNDELAHCFNHSSDSMRQTEWLTNHDIDEFPYFDGARLTLTQARGLEPFPSHSVLDRYASNTGVGAVIVDRVVFDSSGHMRPNYEGCSKCSGLVIKDYTTCFTPDPWHQAGKVFQLTKSVNGWPNHVATMKAGYRAVTASLQDWSTTSMPVYHPLSLFHYERKSYAECTHKLKHNGWVNDPWNKSNWRSMHPEMCNKSMIGMAEYEPNKHQHHLNLSESLYVGVLKHLLLRG